MFNINSEILSLSSQIENELLVQFEKFEQIAEHNQQKVLKAFHHNKVSESHFAETTGYGYGDRGREVLDEVLAQVFECEDALIRHSFASGTATITAALFGILRPSDRVLVATGTPYDTLHATIGLKPASGNLTDFGVKFDIIDLKDDGQANFSAIEQHLRQNSYKMIYIQRSSGYALRPSLTAEECGKIAQFAKNIQPEIIAFCDNCYGEFAEIHEPTFYGVDLLAGSLIKNPGGGIARSGGYIAGGSNLIEMCANRITAPGVGREVGASLGFNRELFLGLFNAPQLVLQCLKSAAFAAKLFEKLNYETSPKYNENRADIIQKIILKSPQNLEKFCRGLQSGAPIDSHVIPEAWDMPGYDDKVIMSAGAFTSGASSEVSADGAMRAPYAAFYQGGLNYHSAKVALMLAASELS